MSREERKCPIRVYATRDRRAMRSFDVASPSAENLARRKASPRAPRLIDFSWGSPKAPRVTLVGKGVCFDTGGLDIKPASGMLLMKKDMGGAAFGLTVFRTNTKFKLCPESSSQD